MDYRFKESVGVITFPQGFVEEDRGFPSCCCEFNVLASASSTDLDKNDVEGVHIKKSDPSDIVTFTIEKCGIVGALANLGNSPTFPAEPLGVGFEFDWRQYLLTYGAGEYEITVNTTISGVVGSYSHGIFHLAPFSISRAAGTVRIRSVFNSYYLAEEFDFTDSQFTSTIRFGGFFGNKDPKTDINNLITKGRVVEKSTRENVPQYTLRTDPLLECVSRVIDFHLLNEDECFLTDHNAHNHSYQFQDFKCVPEEPTATEYPEFSRFVNIEQVFGKRKKTDKSYYNG